MPDAVPFGEARVVCRLAIKTYFVHEYLIDESLLGGGLQVNGLAKTWLRTLFISIVARIAAVCQQLRPPSTSPLNRTKLKT